MTGTLGHVVDIHNDPSSVNSTYRLYPNGSMSEDGYMFKGEKFSNLDDYFRSDTYKENPWKYQLVLPQQLSLTKDSAMDKYREKDGSVLYPYFVQGDMLYVPTKYTDSFVEAATLHGKHDVFLEVAFPKIIDMVFLGSNYTTDDVNLCTEWKRRIRGSDRFLYNCMRDQRNFGFIHPYKIFKHGFAQWSKHYDWLQTSL